MPTDPLRPGDPRELGGYRLLARLGEGGMGAVFLGQAPDGGLVAVKAIRPDLAGQAEFRGRFRSEVNRARAVPAFCTAPVLDADPDSVTPYLVVEYVDGPSLADVVTERGPLSGGDLHSVAIGVATALTAIHGAGVIHRDLKPRNVLFSLGTPKVIDFGIARAFEATSNHTRTDQMVGTLAYMAPERFDPEKHAVGPAADVFAWGVVVTYAATGRTPFGADSPAATAGRILTQPPQLTGVRSPLREIVARTLAKDPVERPTAAELLDMLLDTGSHNVAELQRAAFSGHPELQQATEAVRTGRRDRRRSRMLAAVAAGVATLAVLGATGGWAISRFAEPTAAQIDGAVASPDSSSAAAPVLTGDGPVIVDRLDRAGQWARWTDGTGECAFTGGHLVVSSQSGTAFCPGPQTKFAKDQSVAATVELLEPGSCVSLLFRRVFDTEGYGLTACADKVAIDLDADDVRTPVASAPATALADGQKHRLELVIQDDVANAELDGVPVLRTDVDDRRMVSGYVQLGVDIGPEGSSSSVAYQDLEIRTLGGTPPSPAFTDVSRGDTDSVVRLKAVRTGAVVVEPVIYLKNPDFCETFELPADDKRCAYAWNAADSQAAITLPLSDPVSFALVDSKDPQSCLDSTGAATCAASAAEFTSWLGKGEEPVRLKTKNGVAVSLAELHLP